MLRIPSRFSRALCAAILSSIACAQEPAGAASDHPPTAAEIQARIDALKSDSGVSEDLKAKIQEELGHALALAKSAEAFAADAARFLAEREAAPEQLKARKSELELAEDSRIPSPDPSAPVKQLEQNLIDAQVKMQAAAQAVADLEQESARRTQRRSEIPSRLAEIRKAIESLPVAVAEEGADPRLVSARKDRALLERHKLEQEARALEAELASYDARAELLTVRRDLASRRNRNAKAVAEAWQAIVQERRAAEAEQARLAAQAAAAAAQQEHPLLRRLAEENSEIAKELPVLAGKRQRVEQDLTRAKGVLADLKSQIEDLRARVKRAGSTPAIGTLLRQRRAHLRDSSGSARGGSRDLERLSAEAYLASVDWEQHRRALVDDPGLLDLLIDSTPPLLDDPGELATLRGKAQQLLGDRREMLTDLSKGWSSHLAQLEELDATQREIAEVAESYRNFVNERVLWIRSSAPIWETDLMAAAEALAWATGPSVWLGTWKAFLAGLVQKVWPAALVLLLFGLLAGRKELRRRLAAHGQAASRGNNTSYRPTAMALAETLLLAAPVPLALLATAEVLRGGDDPAAFSKAMAAGCRHAAILFAIVFGLREIVRAGGLAEAHFQWRPESLRLLRRNLVLLVPAAFPCAFGLAAIEQQGNDAWMGSFGKLLLLPLLLLLLVFLLRILHPGRGLLGSKADSSLLGRFRLLWFLLAVSAPAALSIMALLGFECTALQLARRIEYTVALVLAGTLVQDLILRKLMLERRRLSIVQMKARMAAARKTAKESGEAFEQQQEEEFRLDPSSIARQTQTLLRGAILLAVLAAGWQIWVDVLPALGIFREFELWRETGIDPPVVITLADLLTALLVMLLTGIAARNLPGLLELLVLQRLKIKAGERHAITTLSRYLLVAIGVILAFGSIGIGWPQLQWLLAAVSVGLGFGLQEIFANFVSGLILLFERPIRVGDFVAVGDVIGKVTKIQIRATTIRDLDNKELVVPNREFVTGRFINWTLTDSLVRMRLAVGIAYGSDTEKARRLLEQAARESPLAARSPEPKALFLGFGESTLDMELRVYVDDYEFHAEVLSDLHGRIDELFRRNGIEIAFPQRDLHLRDAKPIVEMLRREEAGTPGRIGPE
ncbi:MAG: mechanosensitive ion channel [Planctomycetota bacterium]